MGCCRPTGLAMDVYNRYYTLENCICKFSHPKSRRLISKLEILNGSFFTSSTLETKEVCFSLCISKVV